MAEIFDLNIVDNSNTGRWPENMEFSEVNDAGRADEGLLARWYKDMDSSIVASGSSNAFAITSNRVISSLFNNLIMAWTANHSITAATQLNLNGLGLKSVKRFNGDALASGDVISGQPMVTIYKSTPDCWFMISAPAALTGNSFADFDENAAPGTPAANAARLYAFDDTTVTRLAYKDSAGNITTLGTTATQAEMEAAASTTASVSPGRQHFHPGHPKVWAKVGVSGGTPSLGVSYNTTSVTDTGTGLLNVAVATDFSSAEWSCIAMSEEDSGGIVSNLCIDNGTQTAGTIGFRCTGFASNNSDPGSYHIIGLGDHA